MVVSLRHPGTGEAANFILTDAKGGVSEVMQFQEEHRAWFVDNASVVADGAIYLCPPMDPVLLVLPYLRAASRLAPLDHVVKDEAFPAATDLAALEVLTAKMDRVANRKGVKKDVLKKKAFASIALFPVSGSADLNVWQFDEAKTLSYLESKVRRLSDALLDRGVSVEGGAVSGNFVKSLNTEVDKSKETSVVVALFKV